MAGPVNFSPQQSSTFKPGYTNINATRPESQRTYDYDAWKLDIINVMADNISKGPGYAGYPQTWNQPGGWEFDIGNPNGVSAATVAKIASWIDSGAAANDPFVQQYFGAPPARTSSSYIESPETFAARVSQEKWEAGYNLSVREQEFNEYKFGVSLALDAAQQRASYVSGSRSGGGGGGGGSGQTDSEYQAYLNAKLALDRELGMGRLALDQAEQAALAAYRNAQIALETQKMQQDAAQFGQSFGLQQQQFEFQKEQAGVENTLRAQQLQNERAQHIAKLSANPGDMMEREYYLRAQDAPLGQRVDAFTGQQVNPGQMVNLQTVLDENWQTLNAQGTAVPGIPSQPQPAPAGGPPMPAGAPPLGEAVKVQPAQAVPPQILAAVT